MQTRTGQLGGYLWLAVLVIIAGPACGAAGGPAAPASADIIVIGAGFAGVSAARRLQDAGLQVVVLEGRRRIGGRAYTVQQGKARIDLGAAWCHFTNDPRNPIPALAKKAEVALQRRPTNYENDMLFQCTGTSAVPDACQTVSSAEQDRYDATFFSFEEFYSARRGELDPFDPGLGALAEQFIAAKALAGRDLLAFKYALDVNIQHEYGAPISNLSAWYDEDSAPDVAVDRLVVGGMQNIVAWLARVPTALDIRLRHKVVAVDYSSSLVKVLTQGGATFVAKAVVVTVPLGVLKRGSVQFMPALPAAHLSSMASLGMGILNKVVLGFSKPFWNPRVELFERISQLGDGSWEEILSLLPATGQPILVAFNAASAAARMEERSDGALVAELMAVLDQMFDGVPDKPIFTRVTRWGKDEFSFGSYSYSARGLEGGSDGFGPAHTNLAKPVNGRVFFAGEHTDGNNPATVQGAYRSGQTAACSVLKVYGQRC